jgi:hypothetical protein
MPYLNGEYLTDDEVTEREMAARAQSQDRAAAPIRSMYQPNRSPTPGPWEGPMDRGRPGGPWADTRRDLSTGPWEGRMEPLVPRTDPGPIGMPPWMRETDRRRDLPTGGRQLPSRNLGQSSLQASGRRARAIAREAFAARQRAQQAGPQGRQGGRRGRPASHPGGGRGGLRLGDLLGGFGGRAFSRGSTLSRVPQAVVGGMAGGAPRAALGGWMGGRR